MQKKYFNSEVIINKVDTSLDDEIIALWNEILNNLEKRMTNYQFSEALKEIWRFISRMNKYIDECEPWNLFKDETLKNRLSTVMYNLIESLYKIAVLIFPFMPDTAKKITESLLS